MVTCVVFYSDNTASAVMKELDVTAVVNPAGTNEADIVQSVTGKVYVAQSPEAFTYDDDGNMLSDGRFTYTWDGENRLTSIETSEAAASTGASRVKVEYSYDHRSRRIGKVISHGGAEAQSWEVAESRSFLYDGWNMIQELTHTQTHTLTNSYTWGLDLDGSLQGAGGVGGLLDVDKDTAIYIPAWDANGNIMEYVAEDGSIVAHREYDPFGGTVVATGDAADFTHWFSTKPWCGSTGLSEYQFRKYSPVLGRWLSRDPIGEEGGLNINSIARNDVIGKTDYAGLIPNDCCPEEAKTKYYECLAAVEKWSAKRLADAALVRDTALSANQSAYESLRDGAKVEGDKCRKKCQDQFGNSFAGSSCIFLCDQAEGAAINVVYAAYVLQRGTIYATYGGLVAYVELSAKNQRKKCEDDLTKECPYENKK